MDEKTKHDRARRAVACPGWRWMPGMRAMWPDDARWCRRFGEPHETSGWVSDYSGKERDRTDDGALPDLDDPATLGCLLALVREAYGDPFACVDPPTDVSRSWMCFAGHLGYPGETEAEALVAALEAAR